MLRRQDLQTISARRDGAVRAINVFGTSLALLALFVATGCGLSGWPSVTEKSPTQSDAHEATLTASSTIISFGNVAVGTSTSELVTLTNTGDANANISSISVSGKGFTESGGQQVTLAPNQSVTVSLNFNPSAAGTAQGSMSVDSNASNSLLQVSLTGTGFQPNVQHSVALSWQASTSQVLGYFVYRGTQTNNLLKLNASIDAQTSYTDSTVAGGQTYLYAVTSVGVNNVESQPSAPVSITIPAE